jgi:hypothetical protein
LFVQKKLYFRLRAAPSIDLYFETSSEQIPTDNLTRFMIDAKTNQIGFLATRVTFDNTKIHLSSDVQPSDKLTTIVKITSMQEANQTGVIDIVLGLSPGSTAPTGIFEFARADFTTATTNQATTNLNYDINNTQIVDLNPLELTANLSSTSFTLNQQIQASGEIKLVPDTSNLAVNSITKVNLSMTTGGANISSISMRITASLDNSQPEVQVVDSQAQPISTIQLNSDLLLSGSWSFPVNTITQQNGQLTIDFSAVNTEPLGYSNINYINLGSFYLLGSAITTNPVVFTFDTSQTKMLNKNDPPQNVLLAPSDMQITVYKPDASLEGVRFKLQGISIPGIIKQTTIDFDNQGTNTSYTVPFKSEVGGTFSNTSKIMLTNLPVDLSGTDYEVYAKASGWLRKHLGLVTINPSLNAAPSEWSNMRLIAGDFDNNNILDIRDISLLLSQYTQLSTPVNATSEIYDLDGSGDININDIAIILSNYTALQIPGD